MKIDIYILIYNPEILYKDYEKYNKYISSERVCRIQRFIFNKDKLNSLFAELLLRRMLVKYHKMNISQIEICYEPSGKPFLKNNEILISISHSENCVAIAISDEPTGIDTEKISEYYEEIVSDFFCKEEYKYINSSKNKCEEFYKIWTKKEAFTKINGEGLSIPLNSFNVLDNDFSQKCFTIKKDDFFISVCSERIIDENHINIHFLNIADIED